MTKAFSRPFCLALTLLLYVQLLPSFAASIAPSSGKALCSALSPRNFSDTGIPVSSLKEANIDDPASAYCVYASNSGKVEFDIFYPAGDSPDAAKGTETTVLKEVGGKFDPIQVTGADSAEISLNVPGKLPSASIVIRKKTAVFTIGIPQSANARHQLVTLAEMVLSQLR